jgi:hypothetical protein
MAARRPPTCALLIGLTAAFLAPNTAVAFTEAFFGDLPENAANVIEECVEREECEGLEALNLGPQFFVLQIWGRQVSDAFIVDSVGGSLIVDAGELEQLTRDYYLWPKNISRRGKVNLFDLPGLTVEREGGLIIGLQPHPDYAPKFDLGGYRAIGPEEFDIPGYAVFGELSANADFRFGRPAQASADPRFRLGSELGAQWGLWQFRSRSWFDTQENRLGFDYGYLDRPILSRALRFRSGYMPIASGCRWCASGRMLGVSIASDSLGGLLYRAADTAFLQIDVGGDVDEIEIFVNGRSVRSESVFPGQHNVAVTSLEDGPNSIEIFGINRSTGARRLLAASTQTASTGVLPESVVERRFQLGWAVDGSSARLGEKFSFSSPFLQYEQSSGMGHGRELDLALVAAPKGALSQAGINFRLGNGRAGIRALGSFGDGSFGGGAGFRVSQRFQRFSVGASGDICFDCFNAASFAVAKGANAQGNINISTRALGWSASAALTYSTMEDDAVGWRASLNRNVLGGHLSLYASGLKAVRERDSRLPRRGSEFGFRFTRSFGGGNRNRSLELGVEHVDDRLATRTTYQDTPRLGTGFSFRGSVDGADLRAVDAKTTSVSAGAGYQNSMFRSAVNATARDGASEVNASATVGFALADGQFVLSRSALGGGVFASGLAPGSSVFVRTQEWGTTNRFGQVHLRGLRERARIDLDEGLLDGTGVASREANLLPVPGLFYGVGEEFRKQERSYRLVVGQNRVPVSAGLTMRDEDGDVIGYSGYDGVITLSGRPGVFEFQEPERVCRAEFTGNEAADDDLPVLHAICDR